MSTFWKKKIVAPIKGFLGQGLGSRELALSLAFGVTLGTFPVLGATTILCALAALFLKLNLPAIQFANYLVYPLQIFLLVPFYRLGDLIFSTRQHLDPGILKNMLTDSTTKEVIAMLLESTMYAAGAWLLISPLVFFLLYAGLKPAMARLKSKPIRLQLSKRNP